MFWLLLALSDETLHDFGAEGTFIGNLSIFIEQLQIAEVVFAVRWSNVNWVVACLH